MKKVNLSKVFHENHLFLCSTAVLLVVLAIFWIVPTLESSYWHFTNSSIGSLSLQIQTTIILIVIYPAYSFLLCTILSLCRRLKSQDEGGMLSDILESLKAGCIWFITVVLFLGLPALLTGNFKFTSDYFSYFIGGMNIFLFMGTATGIGVSFYSLAKEFNPNKLPIERIGGLPE